MALGREEIVRILRIARRIAVVGLGDRPERPAYAVAAYLQGAGYEIVPVHPRAEMVLGRRGYPDLGSAAATGRLDVVDIFRRPDAVSELVAPCVAARPLLVWLQVGIRNDSAAAAIEAHGIPVVQDRCLAVDHHRLGV